MACAAHHTRVRVRRCDVACRGMSGEGRVIVDDDPAGDWTAPGLYRCAPGVYRIPLPLPNDGLRAVNVYALADGEGLTLIDAGWALDQAREALASALGGIG